MSEAPGILYDVRHIALMKEVLGMSGVKHAALAGSRIVPGGFGADSDYDIVVHGVGFYPGPEWEQHEDYEGVEHNLEVPFTTYRRGQDNLIVYEEYTHFAVFRNLAKFVAKCGIVDKNTRVGVFSDILRETREPEDFDVPDL